MEKEDQSKLSLCSEYSGAFNTYSLSNSEILQITGPDRCLIYGPTLFAMKYRVLPCTTREIQSLGAAAYQDIFSLNAFGQINPQNRGRDFGKKKKSAGMYHATSAENYLKSTFEVPSDSVIYDSYYDVVEGHTLTSSFYIDLGNYLTVHLSGGFITSATLDNPNSLTPDFGEDTYLCYNSVQIFHVPQTNVKAQEVLKELNKFKLYPVVEASLQMVCHNAQRGFYTSMIRMKKPHIPDMKLHYGDDFPEIHEQLLAMLQKKNSTGITLLHGPPGTGKTYYLRYLINEIKEKSLIYVPPDLVNDITKPGFLPFLMQHPNAILIIEDAENIVRDRNKDSLIANQAVSNLLNLSDGLLGDAMHQQIICTFNCDVRGIDPALLREGRLIIEHKFDKLSVENTRRLCKAMEIPGDGNDIHESTALSEIFARKSAANSIDSTSENDSTKIRTYRKKKQTDDLLGFYS